MSIDASQLRRVQLVLETDEFVVVNKPCGLAVHGGAEQSGLNLVEILRFASDDPKSVFPIHRLDRPTSGLVLFAKTSESASAFGQKWAEVEKTYLALIFGVWEGPDKITGALDGKSACTQIVGNQVIGSSDLSLLTLRIETGRTHQIRRHLRDAGTVIAMDDKYGDFRANKAFRRRLKDHEIPWPKKALFLHAYQLNLPNSKLDCRADTPASWVKTLEKVGGVEPNLFLRPNVI